MVWAGIIIGIIVVAIVINEWRTRNKPLSSGLQGQRHIPRGGGGDGGAAT